MKQNIHNGGGKSGRETCNIPFPTIGGRNPFFGVADDPRRTGDDLEEEREGGGGG